MNEIEGSALGRLITGVSRRLWWARARTVLGRGALGAAVLLLLAGLAHRLLGPWSPAEAATLCVLPLLGALATLFVVHRPGAVAAARAADRALGSKGLLVAAVDQSALAEDRRAGAAALVLARAERLAAASPLPSFQAPPALRGDGITLTLALAFALALALAGAVMLGGPGAVTAVAPAAAPPRAAIAAAAPPGPVARAQRSLAQSAAPGRADAAAPFGARPADSRTRRESGIGDREESGRLAVPPMAARDRRATPFPLAARAADFVSRLEAGEGAPEGGEPAGDGAGAGARRAATPADALPPERVWRHRDLAGGAADTLVAGGDARAGFAALAAASGAVGAARPTGGAPLNSLTPGVRAYAEAYLSLLGREP